jgi:hypothetical protein
VSYPHISTILDKVLGTVPGKTKRTNSIQTRPYVDDITNSLIVSYINDSSDTISSLTDNETYYYRQFKKVLSKVKNPVVTNEKVICNTLKYGSDIYLVGTYNNNSTLILFDTEVIFNPEYMQRICLVATAQYLALTEQSNINIDSIIVIASNKNSILPRMINVLPMSHVSILNKIIENYYS